MSLIKELLQHFDDAETRLKASPVVEPALTDVQACLRDLEGIYGEMERVTADAVDAAEHKTRMWLAARFAHTPTPLPAVQAEPVTFQRVPCGRSETTST